MVKYKASKSHQKQNIIVVKLHEKITNNRTKLHSQALNKEGQTTILSV